MPVEEVDSANISRLKKDFMAALKAAGGKSGNIALKRALNWEDSGQYWDIRNRLIEDSLVEAGAGKGGSVKLIEGYEEKSPQVEKITTESKRVTEESLYEPLSKLIKENWVQAQRFRGAVVEVTGKQGRKRTGGKWTRPDITVVGFKYFKYAPGKYFEYITFEVKRYEAVDVTAVYEALAQRRFSTRSILVVYSADSSFNPDDARYRAVMDECVRQGVGLYEVSSLDSYEGWEEVVAATRCEPDHEKIEEFISAQLSDGAKEKISGWMR